VTVLGSGSPLISGSPESLVLELQLSSFLKCLCTYFLERNVAEVMNRLKLKKYCRVLALKKLVHVKLAPCQSHLSNADNMMMM